MQKKIEASLSRGCHWGKSGLRLRFLFFATSFLLTVVVSVVVSRSVYFEKTRLAETFLSAAKLSFATGDLRQASQILQGAVETGFTRVVVLEDELKITEFAREKSAYSIFQPELRVVLGFSQPTTQKKYQIKFYYGVFQPLGLVFVWLIPIFLISYVVFKRSLNKLIHEAELEQKAEHNKALAQLAWQVAHDLKSPLSVISLSLGDPSQEKQIFARNAIKRIDQLMGQLLNQSRGASDHYFVEESFFPSLMALVEEKNFEFQSEPRIKIQADDKTRNQFWEPAMPRADFLRVISNLINNSRRATLDRWAGREQDIPAIEISLKVRGKILILQVKDQGVGIKPEVLVQLGQRRVTTDLEGCGLGLYTAIKTLKKFGGDLKIQSELGQFTIVQVLMPVRYGLTQSSDLAPISANDAASDFKT